MIISAGGVTHGSLSHCLPLSREKQCVIISRKSHREGIKNMYNVQCQVHVRPRLRVKKSLVASPSEIYRYLQTAVHSNLEIKM